jgi:hypothetical protein
MIIYVHCVIVADNLGLEKKRTQGIKIVTYATLRFVMSRSVRARVANITYDLQSPYPGTMYEYDG